MNFHTNPNTELDMIGYDIKTFEFDVDKQGSPYFIVSDHNPELKGFKLDVTSHQGSFNNKIETNTFTFRLIREKLIPNINPDEYLDVTIGICTFPNNKCVKTLKIKIN